MRHLIACAVVAAAAAGVCHAETGDRRPDPIRDEYREEQEAVAATLKQLFLAADRRDIDQVEAIHLYGPKFSKYDDSGPRRDGDQARAEERQTLARVRSYKAEAEGLKVDVIGPVAIATFVFKYAVETERGVVQGKARSTLVFAKDASRWRIVHEHHSPVDVAQ